MAIFNARLFFLHDGSPTSIFLMTQRSLLGRDGTRNGNARSNRRIKKDRSSRKPKPVPTASSSRNVLLENLPPGRPGSSRTSQIFPASTNSAPLRILTMGNRYSAFASSLISPAWSMKAYAASLSGILSEPGPRPRAGNARTLLLPPI